MLALAAAFAIVLVGSPGDTQQNPPTFATEKYVVQAESWIEYTVELVPQGKQEMVTVTCSNPCKGKKHSLHAECDASCDGACTAIHKYEVPEAGKCIPGGDIKDGGTKMGSKTSPLTSSPTSTRS